MISMTITEYAVKYYNILPRIKRIFADPISIVENADDLPYDEVIEIDDQLRKVVYTVDGDPIPVLDLISMTRDQAEKELSEVFSLWDIYMSNIDVKDVTMESIISMAQEMRRKEEERKLKTKCIES